jgi:hypothetical protein
VSKGIYPVYHPGTVYCTDSARAIPSTPYRAALQRGGRRRISQGGLALIPGPNEKQPLRNLLWQKLLDQLFAWQSSSLPGSNRLGRNAHRERWGNPMD